MEHSQLHNIHVQNYTLGTSYCRINHRKGGTCMFVHEGLYFEAIDISRFCTEFYIEACVIKLHIENGNIYIF